MTPRFFALAVVAVVVYLAASLGSRVALGRETFPFFTWDLFSEVPHGVVGRPDVYLHEVGGTRLDPPLRLFESGLDRGRRVEVAQLLLVLSAALAQDPTAAEHAVAGLEDNHLPARCEWALVVAEYQPVPAGATGRCT